MAGDRSAMDRAAAAARAEKERLAAELESTRIDLEKTHQVGSGWTHIRWGVGGRTAIVDLRNQSSANVFLHAFLFLF